MIWNNSVSLTDIISILALIATFITVVLIFVQRHDSAKPVLFVLAKNTGGNYLKLTDYGIDFELEKCPIQLCCFGNNLAKKICIESYFLLDKDLSFYKSVSIKGGFLKVNVKNKPLAFVVLKPTKRYYETINCNETIDLTNELQGKLLGILLCGFDAISQRDDKGIPFSKSCIVLKMSYMDMYGKKYDGFFTISFSFSSLSDDIMHFSFETKQISKKVFKKYISLYKKQNCCGWFGNNYIPSYDRQKS